MNIEGAYTLQAPPEEVWQCLMDREGLLRTIPGIEQVEQINEHTYDIKIQLKYATLKGSYQVRLTISEQHYPTSYRLTVEGLNRQNTFQGTGIVHLHPQSHTTVITYKGDVSVGKLGTLLPSTLIKGGSKLIIQQYFQALSAYVQKNSNTIVIVSTPPEPPKESKTFFGKVTQILKLGHGDPVQEAQWEKKLRQASAVTGLVFLVWVGTRLPRR